MTPRPVSNSLCPIDYRATFLRWHVASELERTDDVFAVGELRERLTTALGEAIGQDAAETFSDLLHEQISLERFFYDDRPDYRLYVPIRVFPVKQKKPVYRDLTELLRGLASRATDSDRSPGVVLMARSGGGKTVACRKAFCDCFLFDSTRACSQFDMNTQQISPPPAPPCFDCVPLAGYLPCWLPIYPELERITGICSTVGAEADRDRRKTVLHRELESVHEEVVEGLILRAATVDGKFEPCFRNLGDLLGTWLAHGPPLLIFLDLNSFGGLERQIVAKSLVSYQRKYPRHRCVVTYRSTQEDDDTMAILRKGDRPLFEFYDMEPMPRVLAQKYQGNFRKRENELRGIVNRKLKESCSPPGCRLPTLSEADVEATCAKLGELIDRYVRGGESLISTPLLMYWVSLPDVEELKRVQTLADLCGTVVGRQLRRDWGEDASMARLARVAMTRVALAMQAKDQTVLEKHAFWRLLGDPEATGKHHGFIGGQAQPWWPDEGDPNNAFWLDREEECTSPPKERQVPYYWRKFSNEEIEPIQEFSLFRREGGNLRFLHDSLIYYFAGVTALVNHRQPGEPSAEDRLGEAWFDRVVARVRQSPAAWEWPVEFLSGAMDEKEFEELLVRLLPPKPEPNLPDPWQGIPELALRLCRGGTGPLAASGSEAILRLGSRLRHNPQAVFQQVYGYLKCCETQPGPCRRFAAGKLLESARAPGSAWLRCVLARPSRAVRTMAEHTREVTSVAALSDGRIVSGSEDHTVKLWDPATGEVRTMAEHTREVRSVAALSDGRIVSGSEDGTVKLWDPATGEVRTMAEHTREVRSVAALSDGRIVSGSEDGTVKLWDPATGEVRTMAEHTREVRSVAALSDGRIVSGSEDGTVKLWDPATGEVLTYLADASIVHVACAPSAPRIAAGLLNGEVLVLEVEPECSRL